MAAAEQHWRQASVRRLLWRWAARSAEKQRQREKVGAALHLFANRVEAHSFLVWKRYAPCVYALHAPCVSALLPARVRSEP